MNRLDRRVAQLERASGPVRIWVAETRADAERLEAGAHDLVVITGVPRAA